MGRRNIRLRRFLIKRIDDRDCVLRLTGDDDVVGVVLKPRLLLSLLRSVDSFRSRYLRNHKPIGLKLVPALDEEGNRCTVWIDDNGDQV